MVFKPLRMWYKVAVKIRATQQSCLIDVCSDLAVDSCCGADLGIVACFI